MTAYAAVMHGVPLSFEHTMGKARSWEQPV